MNARKGIQPRIAAVVLAAGGSTRMGQAKQLLPIAGQPMVRRAAQTVCQAGLAQVVVVVGAQAEPVAEALAGLPVQIVVNEAWAAGLSTSVRAGLEALRPEIQAVLMVLADQPALSTGLLEKLVARYEATGAPIVAPLFEGRRGNPILFDRSLFDALGAVEGDRGGRELLQLYEEQVERLEIDDAAILIDIDTPQDYDTVLGNAFSQDT